MVLSETEGGAQPGRNGQWNNTGVSREARFPVVQLAEQSASNAKVVGLIPQERM